MDVDTGVATLQAGERDAQHHVSLRRWFVLAIMEGNVHVYPAGTADKEASLLFGVAVDEDAALEEAGFEGYGTVHAHLLVDGEEGFKRSVLERVVGEGSHG